MSTARFQKRLGAAWCGYGKLKVPGSTEKDNGGHGEVKGREGLGERAAEKKTAPLTFILEREKEKRRVSSY